MLKTNAIFPIKNEEMKANTESGDTKKNVKNPIKIQCVQCKKVVIFKLYPLNVFKLLIKLETLRFVFSNKWIKREWKNSKMKTTKKGGKRRRNDIKSHRI